MGLPNRRLLVDRLEQTLARGRRHGNHAALMFLDLDHFKRVNDTLGHAIGDKLLVEIAQRMRSMLRKAIEVPMLVDGNELHITVSIGVRLLSDDVNDVSKIFRHADMAMCRAKDNGRNTVSFFATDMQKTADQRLGLEHKHRAAIESSRDLEPYLQPQYNCTRQICGAEMLLRWRSDGEFIPPDI